MKDLVLFAKKQIFSKQKRTYLEEEEKKKERRKEKKKGKFFFFSFFSGRVGGKGLERGVFFIVIASVHFEKIAPSRMKNSS